MSEISHIVKSYEEELQNLNDNLIKMGSLVETQLSDSMEAIIKVDKEAAENIIKNDAKINELRATIEEQIVNVLVKRAPMAIDLRLTISTLKISSDLERIGDLAKSVAKKIKPLPHDLPEELIASLRRLGDLVQRQLKDILDAYLKKSKELAIKIWKTDEKVDDLTHTAMNEVADFLGKDKKNLDLATHLLFVTKNIERAGDHITNIAESLFYLIEGEHIEGARPKGKDFDLKFMSANIYIIEDEEPIITLIKYNLEKEGYKVSYSDNGNDGIKEIKKKLPDLILLDWMLPDFSGVEICKNLKKDIKFKDLPIIMLTAKGEEEDKVKGLNSGADDYITKPFSFPELVSSYKSTFAEI